jgi:anti-sigma B factor antagonist
MEMNVEEVDGLTRIALVGKLDIKGAEAIDLKFTAIAGQRPKVAVDLSGVDYMASMGIRMLVTCGKAASRRGHKLAMYGAQEPVGKVITTSGLDQIVPLASDYQAVMVMLA